MKKLLIAVVLLGCLAVAGCGVGGQTDSAGPGTVIETAKDNASVVACRTNRGLLDQQYSMAQAESPGGTADFAALVKSAGVKCPSGGVYSFDETAQKTKCSVHGE